MGDSGRSGITLLEDKIFRRATAEVLNAISETDVV
jgi:hypothetical protein